MADIEHLADSTRLWRRVIEIVRIKVQRAQWTGAGFKEDIIVYFQLVSY